ncbi:hypothetical protein SCYAM73S_01374 [Streptomyces cyaneofuscatus]
MADSTSTLDTSAYFTELQGSNERTLLARIERAVREGELSTDADPAALMVVLADGDRPLSGRICRYAALVCFRRSFRRPR